MGEQYLHSTYVPFELTHQVTTKINEIFKLDQNNKEILTSIKQEQSVNFVLGKDHFCNFLKRADRFCEKNINIDLFYKLQGPFSQFIFYVGTLCNFCKFVIRKGHL